MHNSENKASPYNQTVERKIDYYIDLKHTPQKNNEKKKEFSTLQQKPFVERVDYKICCINRVFFRNIAYFAQNV